MESHLTRRQFVGSTLAAGATAGLATSGLDPIIQRALAAAPKRGHLRDIEHVVILIQENRSFDHYFGTFKGVRGFDDKRGRAAFTQSGYAGAGHGGKLVPFRLNSRGEVQCTDDITHEWAAQHRARNGGKMDRFVAEHVTEDGADIGPLTMGYYTGSDIPFYHSLANAFTLCDNYHCSVIGPTDPNRLYTISATLDPAGTHGGPLLETLVARRASMAGKFTWTTMPEQLSARKISWKSYTGEAGGLLDNPLPYFRNFQQKAALKARGIKPVYPKDFVADVRANRLPQVSWIAPSLNESEHPGFSTAKTGEKAARDVVSALTSNPKVWAKTALFITWDENGGFFDHVSPPSPPAGTRGEYLTVPTLPKVAEGIRGPIGLGFRVPMIVVSPFSRGGYVCSEVFDHTSPLQFLEKRFGAEVPNLTSWRRKATGDMVSAFSFGKPNKTIPKLPAVRISPSDLKAGGCKTTTKVTPPPNKMPTQIRGRAKRPVR